MGSRGFILEHQSRAELLPKDSFQINLDPAKADKQQKTVTSSNNPGLYPALSSNSGPVSGEGRKKMMYGGNEVAARAPCDVFDPWAR